MERPPHPNCNGDHPGRGARFGPYTWDQCRLCWIALNEPEKVRALTEGRTAAVRAAGPTAPVKSRWPWLIWLLTWLRHRGDAGVGDTIKRRLSFIGKTWDWWHVKTTGEPCKPCGDKRVQLNVKYPYRPGRGWRLPV